MTILVRRKTASAFEVVSGMRSLLAGLHFGLKVPVQDADTGESFEVHLVDGEIVALQRPGEAEAETIAAAAIERAAQL